MWLSKERLERKVNRVPESSYQLELQGQWTRGDLKVDGREQE